MRVFPNVSLTDIAVYPKGAISVRVKLWATLSFISIICLRNDKPVEAAKDMDCNALGHSSRRLQGLEMTSPLTGPLSVLKKESYVFACVLAGITWVAVGDIPSTRCCFVTVHLPWSMIKFMLKYEQKKFPDDRVCNSGFKKHQAIDHVGVKHRIGHDPLALICPVGCLS